MARWGPFHRSMAMTLRAAALPARGFQPGIFDSGIGRLSGVGYSLEALLEAFPAKSQRQLRWPCSVWKLQRPSLEIPVTGRFCKGMQADCQLVWMYSHKVQIEQGVEVCSEE